MEVEVEVEVDVDGALAAVGMTVFRVVVVLDVVDVVVVVVDEPFKGTADTARLRVAVATMSIATMVIAAFRSKTLRALCNGSSTQ